MTKKSKDLASLRNDIQTYIPGRKLLPAGDKTKHDYVIPQKTVLLLVGDMGAGKSTLVNNIHRAVNNTRVDLDIAATASELHFVFVRCEFWFEDVCLVCVPGSLTFVLSRVSCLNMANW